MRGCPHCHSFSVFFSFFFFHHRPPPQIASLRSRPKKEWARERETRKRLLRRLPDRALSYFRLLFPRPPLLRFFLEGGGACTQVSFIFATSQVSENRLEASLYIFSRFLQKADVYLFCLFLFIFPPFIYFSSHLYCITGLKN